MTTNKNIGEIYSRSIESMGVGLVLFDITAKHRDYQSSYGYLFFNDGRKPPLEIAVSFIKDTIEYVSFFAQDEKAMPVASFDWTSEGTVDTISWRTIFRENERKTVDIDRKFQLLVCGNSIAAISPTNKKFKAYRLTDNDSLLFTNDDFCGVIMKNLTQAEMFALKASGVI